MCTPSATYIVYIINNAPQNEQKEETMKERAPINKVKLAIGLTIAFGAMYGTEKLLANLNKEEPTSSSYQTTTEPPESSTVVEQPIEEVKTDVQGAKTEPKKTQQATQSIGTQQTTQPAQNQTSEPQPVTTQPTNNTNNQTTRNNTQNNTIVDQNNEDSPPTTEENEQSNNNQNNAQ